MDLIDKNLHNSLCPIDKNIHPKSFSLDYKSSILRSPKKDLVSIDGLVVQYQGCSEQGFCYPIKKHKIL